MTYGQLQRCIMKYGQQWLDFHQAVSNGSNGSSDKLHLVLGDEHDRFLFNPECIPILWTKQEPEVTAPLGTLPAHAKYLPNLDFWKEHSYLWLIYKGSAKQDRLVARLVSLAWLELVFHETRLLSRLYKRIQKAESQVVKLMSSHKNNGRSEDITMQQENKSRYAGGSLYSSLLPCLWLACANTCLI